MSRGMQKIGCGQEALYGFMSLIDKLKVREIHSTSELFFGSQAYYRISQLHSELKFTDKAQNYMETYEKLQEEYLIEMEKRDKSREFYMKKDYLTNQLLKRKAWLLHIA